MNQVTSISGSIPAEGAQLAPIPEVQREFNDLLQEIEQMAIATNSLIARLRPVVREVPNSAVQVGPKLEECYSELGNCIRNASDLLRSERTKLNGLLETLAV